MRSALVLVALVLAGCASPLGATSERDARAETRPVAPVDPFAPGPLGVASSDYDAGEVEVGGPDANRSEYAYDARLRGHAWWPDAMGSFPVLVFLHGQHGTCAMGRDEAWIVVDDCGDDEGLNTPYRNDLGYAYLAEHLASHGYVVVSILAHEVNQRNGAGDVGMWARGELVLATLDAIRDGRMASEVASRADLARVGLMGHSRGGEGVVTAVHVNRERPETERHAIRAVVALAPTDFNGRGAPDVALLSLVPTCDGDVAQLHGLRTFDHSRHLDDATDKVQVVVRGANHNFYNTRWYDDHGLPVYPGDDAPFQLSPSCYAERGRGGVRWTPEETQRESIVHVGGFLRLHAGGERGLAPFFTGERPLPREACPRGEECPDAAVVTAMPAGAARILVVEGRVPEAHALGGRVALEGFSSARVCERTDCDVHMGSGAPALALSWRGPATLRLVLDGADWSTYDALSFRAAVPGWDSPITPRVDVGVTLVGPEGEGWVVRASEHSTALQRPSDPPTPVNVRGTARLALQAVRIPLDVVGTDTSDVREVVLSFEGEGTIFLTDVVVAREPGVVS